MVSSSNFGDGQGLAIHRLHMRRCFLVLIRSCLIARGLRVSSSHLPCRSSGACFAAASPASSFEAPDFRVFTIVGMRCMGCVEKIQSALRAYDPEVVVTLSPPQAQFSKPLSVLEVNRILSFTGDYKASANMPKFSKFSAAVRTYTPLLGIFTAILAGTMALQFGKSPFSLDLAMPQFMGLYFIIFSFFKLLNLKGFAESFRMYDLLASKSRIYAVLYPFIEFSLGFLYLRNMYTFTLNVFSFFLMAFSSLGVLRALLQKRKIACACLGTFFNLPMTYVSLLEDLLMSFMALMSIFRIRNFKFI